MRGFKLMRETALALDLGPCVLDGLQCSRLAIAQKERIMRGAWLVALSVALLTLFTDNLSAQLPVLLGNNIDVSSGLTLQRRSPSVAYNSANNEYLVVWFDL